MTVGSNKLYFGYDASGAPLQVVYNGTTYYYVTNLQGDVIAILNSSGTAVVQYTYDAWGNPITTTGSMATTLGATNPLRYRGYVYDQETHLYYLQSRYYNPKTGRFLNADSYVATGQDTLGNNMLAYCQNSPATRYDPNGRAFLYSDTLNRGLSGYVNLGGNATGVSTASPSGGPDGFPISIVGFLADLFGIGDSSSNGAVNAAQTQPYNYNGLKNEKYVSKRGWTDDMIRYSIKSGQRGTSVNMATNSSCTAYRYPGTNNQYVIIDDSTRSIVQVSNFNDTGWIPDGRIQWLP